VTEMVRKSNETAQPLSSISVSVSGLILSANIQRLISAATVKEIFHGPQISLQEAENKIKEYAQVSDEAAIAEACDKVLAAESAKLAEYRAGRDKLYGFFVGAVMKAMGGKGNPKVVNEVLRRKLAG
jgi:aspartyl-tRNA(Asn)/glutamyl-tRNA(Gln) amidotransferase subunit B